MNLISRNHLMQITADDYSEDHIKTAVSQTENKSSFSMRRLTSSIMMVLLWMIMIVFVVIKYAIDWLRSKAGFTPTKKMEKVLTY